MVWSWFIMGWNVLNRWHLNSTTNALTDLPVFTGSPEGEFQADASYVILPTSCCRFGPRHVNFSFMQPPPGWMDERTLVEMVHWWVDETQIRWLALVTCWLWFVQVLHLSSVVGQSSFKKLRYYSISLVKLVVNWKASAEPLHWHGRVTSHDSCSRKQGGRGWMKLH